MTKSILTDEALKNKCRVSEDMDIRILQETNSSSVTDSVFKVMAGGALALAAGLVSQVVVAAIFGAAADMDAYLTAVVVPNFLAYALISGLSFVLIPAFVQEDEKGSKEDAWAMVGTCFWITVVVLLIVAIVGSLLANQVIAWTAPGFRAEKAELAASMLAISMFTVPCIALGSLMRGLQSARNQFFWPSFAQGIGSLGNVGTLLALYPSMGSIALAWGNLVAMILAAAVPTIPVLRHGWKRLLPLNDRRIIRLGILLSPFIVFGLVTNSATVLERYFASNLRDGDLSYLGYAYKISAILVAVLASSIASAIFPTMAREHALRGHKGLIEQTEYGLRLTFATAFPALAVCGAAALLLVMVLFEHGAFSHATSVSVSQIVLIVLLGDLFFRMTGNMISRTLYVVHDTLTFPLLSAAGIILYIPLAKTLTEIWGYVGLALAMPVQKGVANLAVFIIMVLKVRPFDLGRLGKDVLLYLIASLVAAFCTWWVITLLSSFPDILQIGAGFLAAGITYLLLMHWIDRSIAFAILEMFGVGKLLKRLWPGFSRTPMAERLEVQAGK